MSVIRFVKYKHILYFYHIVNHIIKKYNCLTYTGEILKFYLSFDNNT